MRGTSITSTFTLMCRPLSRVLQEPSFSQRGSPHLVRATRRSRRLQKLQPFMLHFAWSAKKNTREDGLYSSIRKRRCRFYAQPCCTGHTNNWSSSSESSFIRCLLQKGRRIAFQWLPSHSGILGDEHADNAARTALEDGPQDMIPLLHSDLSTFQ